VVRNATAEADAELPQDGRLARGVTRRREIVAAAGTLFARRGFAGVSVEELAAAAGVSGPGVYRHFGGKDEVLAAVIAPATDVLFAPLAAAGRPKDRLRDFFERLAAATAVHGDAIALAHREWPNLPAVERERYRRALGRTVAELTALLRAWRPGVSEGDAATAVDVAIGVGVHVGHPGTSGFLTEERVRTVLPELAMAVLAAVPAESRSKVKNNGGRP
jgi:AcrR family transcriptional regulator